MKKLILVPPDTRPPTLDLPVKLAMALGFEASAPPPAALPSAINQPGRFEVLRDDLRSRAKETDILICCLETLCLGGMIPARRVTDSLAVVMERLALLTELKMLNEALNIYAFGVIVRVPHGNDPYEEKAYFAEYGDALRRYSWHYDRYQRYMLSEDKDRFEEAQALVPEAIFNDWLGTRQRNHQLHREALNLVKQGLIEHLCLTLDDTTQYGLAALDRRALEALTDDLALWPQVDIYPGADEVPCTLLARAVQSQASKVYVRYSSSLGPAAGMMFEDRPAGELIKAQLRAAKCYQVDSASEADWVLAVNVPAHEQSYESAQPDYAQVDTSSRHLPDFVDSILRMMPQKAVAIADIAYPNGAELRFMKLLRQRVALSELAAFGAWNTAGNTLGSTIAMAVCAQFKPDTKLWTALLFNRLVDDYLYQAWVRREVQQGLNNPDVWDLGEQRAAAEEALNRLIQPKAEALWQEHFAHGAYQLNWQPAYLAWPRLFTGVFPFSLVERPQEADTG